MNNEAVIQWSTNDSLCLTAVGGSILIAWDQPEAIKETAGIRKHWIAVASGEM